MIVVNFVLITIQLLKFLSIKKINLNKVVHAICCGSEDSYINKDIFLCLSVF